MPFSGMVPEIMRDELDITEIPTIKKKNHTHTKNPTVKTRQAKPSKLPSSFKNKEKEAQI